MKCETDKLLVAIRAKCLDCCGSMRGEVERCKIQSCPLHPYRSLSVIGRAGVVEQQVVGQICLFDEVKKRKGAV